MRTSPDRALVAHVVDGLLVTGLVRNGAGNPEPDVEVKGCGQRVSADADGRFSMVVEPGTCALWAQRVDGVLPTEGARVEVTGLGGGTVEVILVLPEYPQGFAGVFLGIGEGASRVVSVSPGSQAEAEGVRSGHVVLRIDDEPVQDLDAAGLWARILGDAGTTVALTLRTPKGTIYTVELDRDLVGN